MNRKQHKLHCNEQSNSCDTIRFANKKAPTRIGATNLLQEMKKLIFVINHLRRRGKQISLARPNFGEMIEKAIVITDAFRFA